MRKSIISEILEKRIWWLCLLIFVFCTIFFFHVWRLGELPRGLYVDESSIGYNAALIAENGHDEHNNFFPLYFKSFGYAFAKDPVYVYAASLIFRFWGPSEFNLRLPGALFFLFFLLGIYLLVKTFFKNNKFIILYSLVAVGFLPWFFSLSRIAFEVNSQLPIFVFALYFLYKTYQEPGGKRKILFAVISGFFTGLLVYTYGTARLSVFFMVVSILVIYLSKENIKKHLYFLGSFFVFLIPYFIFLIQNPGAIAARFRLVTYIYRDITFWEKIWLFLKNYFSYISFNYLIIFGDSTGRHHPSHGGEIFIVVFLLFLVGLIFLVRKNYDYFRANKFLVFLSVNLVLSPIPAALTRGDSSLRSILIGFYIVIFSCFGVLVISQIKNRKLGKLLLFSIFLFLLSEASLNLRYYFFQYPQISAGAFESYDFKSVLLSAISQKPSEIMVSNKGNQPYAHLEFYKRIIPNGKDILMKIDDPVARPNTCVIYFPSRGDIINPNNLEIKFSAGDNNYTRVRCY